MPLKNQQHREMLSRIADNAMQERGLESQFSQEVEEQLLKITSPAQEDNELIHDLTDLLWCSIDNDDSLDLDQLTVAEKLHDRSVKIYVAIADVDALVRKNSPIDQHAQINTTSVYSSAKVFPMLPLKLSNNLTSLNYHENRLAIVVETIISEDGNALSSKLYRARVRNKAKLAYDSVSAWIEQLSGMPAELEAVTGMDQQIIMQDTVAQKLRKKRHSQGSLEFETFQPKAIFKDGRLVGIAQQPQNRARQLIEEFMIVTNTAIARFLATHGGASLRRVVRSPERWLRICEYVRQFGETLPRRPNSTALEKFLAKQHKTDPLHFPDISLTIIKLMGSGEYVVERSGELPIGHFGLAVQDYTHSTAPNRRYPDLISMRMVKAALAKETSPYTLKELEGLALHCTEQEDASRKVERRIRKSEAALYLEPFLGSQFDAIVTGINNNGTWVRLISPPAEGMLIHNATALTIGEKIRVKLVTTDVEHGFIDFIKVPSYPSHHH